jgi:hypothetical protein
MNTSTFRPQNHFAESHPSAANSILRRVIGTQQPIDKKLWPQIRSIAQISSFTAAIVEAELACR